MKRPGVVISLEDAIAKRRARPQFIEAHVVDGEHIYVNIRGQILTHQEIAFLSDTLRMLVSQSKLEPKEPER